MSSRKRVYVALAAIVVLAVPTLALTLAEPPAEPDNHKRRVLELPADPDFKPPVGDDQALNPKIREMIGDSLKRGDFSETGNPAADEVLELIKRRRSVLEGSLLDPAAEITEIRGKQKTAGPSQARAAECLLKAARILEKIDPADKTRRDLVNQMRRESVRLLSPYALPAQ